MQLHPYLPIYLFRRTCSRKRTVVLNLKYESKKVEQKRMRRLTIHEQKESTTAQHVPAADSTVNVNPLERSKLRRVDVHHHFIPDCYAEGKLLSSHP